MNVFSTMVTSSQAKPSVGKFNVNEHGFVERCVGGQDGEVFKEGDKYVCVMDAKLYDESGILSKIARAFGLEVSRICFRKR